MKKQTAVEWLESEIKNGTFISWNKFNEILNRAKEIERAQIEESFNRGLITENIYYGYDDKKAEQYYNETYGKDRS